jgi:hypothetical protein
MKDTEKQKFLAALEKTVCELFEITPLELRSNYQYAQLGTARMIFTMVAVAFGFERTEICNEMGYSSQRVNVTLVRGNEKYMTTRAFKDAVDGLSAHFKKEVEDGRFRD